MARPSEPENGSNTLERRLDIVVTQGAPSQTGSFLLVVAGAHAGKLFPLNKAELLLGRSPSADIHIDEKAVSHNHARILMQAGSCTIQDLDSTNGTFVNNELVSGPVKLRNSDAVGVGGTTFTYMAPDTQTDHTVQLQGGRSQPPAGAGFIDHLRVQPSHPPAYAQAHAMSIERTPDDESMSLTDMVNKVHTYWVYLKRYGWLLMTCAFFGIGAGILQTRVSPPPGSAWFEMTLISKANANPMNREAEGVQFFMSAESAFRSLPLIKKTMEALGKPNISDQDASDLQSELSFERQGFESALWRGEYRDVNAQRATEFLKTHLDVYLDTEIDKTLKVLRTSTEFLREQLLDAKKGLKAAEAKLLQFRDEHPEAIPKDAVLPNPQKQAVDRAKSIAGQISEAQRQIANVEAQLARGTSLARKQVEKSQRFEDEADALRAKLEAARARGLGEQHPDVRHLRDEEARLRSLARKKALEEASDIERRVDAESIALREKLRNLRLKLARLQAAHGTAQKSVDEAKLESLPELQARYQELKRDYDAKRKKYDTLFADLEEKQIKLKTEHALARAHYDLITPPTPEAPSTSKAMVKRAGLGGFVGLVFALLAAVVLEVRQRLLARRRW